MRTAVAIVIIVALVAALALSATAATAQRPVVLVFETAKGDGSDKKLASATTRAVRTYLRDTQRAEATIFNRESPTVLRAIMEQQLTADQVASYSSRAERLTVAKVLSYQYAAGAEVSVANGSVQVKLWMGKVNGGRRGAWEVVGSALPGGSSDRDLDNAMQCATSTAVREIERKALMEVPRITVLGAATPDQSTAIDAAEPPAIDQPTADDYATMADEDLGAGNTALAIEEYSQAVNTDPTDPKLRIRLAEAYAHKGLFSEAYDKLGRAAMIGADAALVEAAKVRIEQIRAGQNTPARTQPDQPPAQREPAPRPVGDRPINNAAAPSVARMIEGDRLWNVGKPDEAAQAYRGSIKINPSDWRAYERLAVVTASISMFTQSREALDQLGLVQPDPPPQILANRYMLLRKAFVTHFAALLRQYDSENNDFENHTSTRETYYNAIKGLAIRLESMARFVDALTVPKTEERAHLHRSLACGLMAQAASGLLEYIEANAHHAKSNAQVFAAQAKREVETAAKLESSKVVVVVE